MYCGKCGTQNPDGATFCSNCGASLSRASNSKPVSISGSAVRSSTGTAATFAKKTNPLPLLIGAGVVIVLVIILVATFTGGRGYKKTIDQMLSASFSADMDKVIDLVPSKVYKNALESNGYTQEELDYLVTQAEQEIQDSLDSALGVLGDNWDYSYTISNETDLNGAELDQIKDSYSAMDVNVSAAKTVDIKVTVSGDDLETSESMSIPLIKVGKSWYLDAITAGNLF